MMSAKYFENYTIILGGAFFRGHAVHTYIMHTTIKHCLNLRCEWLLGKNGTVR